MNTEEDEEIEVLGFKIKKKKLPKNIDKKLLEEILSDYLTCGC